MIKPGDHIRIGNSAQLDDLGMKEFVGKTAIVSACCTGKNNPGVFAVIKSGPHKEEEWFIPIASAQTRANLRRMRCQNILKWFNDKIDI